MGTLSSRCEIIDKTKVGFTWLCKCFLSVCVLVTNVVTVTAVAATSGDNTQVRTRGPSSQLSALRVQFIGTISHTGPSTGLHCAGSGKKLIISQIAGAVLSSLVRYCSAGLLIPSLPPHKTCRTTHPWLSPYSSPQPHGPLLYLIIGPGLGPGPGDSQ